MDCIDCMYCVLLLFIIINYYCWWAGGRDTSHSILPGTFKSFADEMKVAQGGRQKGKLNYKLRYLNKFSKSLKGQHLNQADYRLRQRQMARVHDQIVPRDQIGVRLEGRRLNREAVRRPAGEGDGFRPLPMPRRTHCGMGCCKYPLSSHLFAKIE